MIIALQAEREGGVDIVLRFAVTKKDENGNKKIAKKEHAKLLYIPGSRFNKRLLVTTENAADLGVGSPPEFLKTLIEHDGPMKGDFTYTLILDDFKYQPVETMQYNEIVDEIEKRTGIKPVRASCPKTLAIMALNKLRRLAEQDR